MHDQKANAAKPMLRVRKVVLRETAVDIAMTVHIERALRIKTTVDFNTILHV